MRTINIFKSTLLLALAGMLAFGFNSCKKEDDDDHRHTDGTGHLHLYFKNVMGTIDYMANHEHALNNNGRKYSFTNLRYYVHDINLVKADGTKQSIGNQYLLVSGANVSELDLEGLPAGSYTGLTFKVGVDSTTNKTVDPSTLDSGNPLASTSPSMYWSWASGYIFFRIDGQVDTSVAGNGSANFPFEMHLGTNNFLTPVEVNTNFQVSKDEHPSVTVRFDGEALLSASNMNLGYGLTLGSVDSIKPYTTTHTMDNMPLANKVKASIPAAFSAQ